MSARPNLGPDAWPHRDPGPNGERYCRFCGRQVTGRRESWCGNLCLHQYRIRREPAYAREMVLLRDGGRCALCGLRTFRIAKLLEALRARCQGDPLRGVRPSRIAVARAARVLGALRARGFDVSMNAYPTGFVAISWDALWEADHVMPLAEGGLEEVRVRGLAAYRTACVPCHKGLTRALNERLRAQRAALEGRSGETLVDVFRRLG